MAYTFPTVKKVLRAFKFKNNEARKELKEAVDILYSHVSDVELPPEKLEEVVSKIVYATRLENGIDQ